MIWIIKNNNNYTKKTSMTVFKEMQAQSANQSLKNKKKDIIEIANSKNNDYRFEPRKIYSE